jgi:hypothetical protein
MAADAAHTNTTSLKREEDLPLAMVIVDDGRR